MEFTGTLAEMFSSQKFMIFGILHVVYMTVLWGLRVPWKNAGLVDWGWPSGFFAMALFFAIDGDGYGPRKYLLMSMYLLCGFRFLLGWQVRHKKYGEDRRWDLWKQKWKNGEGLLGIRSVDVNFFFFYQAQALTNVFFFSVPLILASANTSTQLHPLEILGFATWLICFVCENISDHQLRGFKKDKTNRGQVCKIGFWKYSRHPNYFFEFGIWCSYTLYASVSAQNSFEKLALLFVPVLAYWYLVYFTGIPMNEKASLERRGESYAEYQRVTNRFFLWFPKS